MKKFGFILMALAMVMGMTQCKKENTENNENGNGMPELVGEKYEISLNLGGGSNAKAGVHPFEGTDNYAPVYFHTAQQAPNGQADKIEVVYKGKWVGTMTCISSIIPQDLSDYNSASASFSGSITVDDSEIDGSSTLYFYFIGNKPFGNVEGVFTVDISDQTNGLPVISYAASKEPFATGTTSYTINNGYNATGSNWLLNQCALVRFTCENIYHNGTNSVDNNDDAIYTTGRAITIYGMDNQVTIDLTNPGGNNQFTWGTKADSDGAMTLWMPASDTTVRYAIVKPMTYSKTNENLDVAFTPKTVTVGSQTVKADPYGFFGTFNLNADIDNNDYYPDGEIDLVWHSGAFSVSSSEQVVFSRGNIQFNTNTQQWRFAKHQYDWVGGMIKPSSNGDDNSVRQGNVVLDERHAHTDNDWSRNEYITTSTYGWIDIFGWATGSTILPPITTETSTSNTTYTNWKYEVHLFASDGDGTTWRDHDWGNNDIINSGKPGNGNKDWWETLGQYEYRYMIGWSDGSVLPKRENARQKYGLATINTGVGNPTSVKGLVILPDEWTKPSSVTKWTPATEDAAWSNNTYTLAQWRDMELSGAVFLPAAGRRNGTDYDGGGYADQDYGVYWTAQSLRDMAELLAFGYPVLSDKVNPVYQSAPDNGHSVRLVHRLN